MKLIQNMFLLFGYFKFHILPVFLHNVTEQQNCNNIWQTCTIVLPTTNSTAFHLFTRSVKLIQHEKFIGPTYTDTQSSFLCQYRSRILLALYTVYIRNIYSFLLINTLCRFPGALQVVVRCCLWFGCTSTKTRVQAGKFVVINFFENSPNSSKIILYD